MLWMFQRVMYGPITNDRVKSFHDTTLGEYWALAPLVLAIFALGVFPAISTSRTAGAATVVLATYHNGLNPENGGKAVETALAPVPQGYVSAVASAAPLKGNR